MNVYTENTLDIFTILADPTRRLILDSLREQDKTVNELVEVVNIKQSGVSRHLSILSKAGFVSSQKSAQKRIYSLKIEPFKELEEWTERYLEHWDNRFRKLEKHLEKQKGKKNDQ